MEKELSQQFINPEKSKKRKLNRRDFIKLGAYGALGLGAGLGIERLFKSSQESSKQSTRFGPHELVGPRPEKRLESEPQSLDKVLEYNSKRKISINKEVMDKTEDYWKDKHLHDEKYSTSFSKAYLRMKKYIKPLEKIFLQAGVPSFYLFLAVPESYGDHNAESPYAKGLYQFTYNTGKAYGLIKGKRDFRIDPLRSGQACANYLKDLHDRLKDWNMVLARYNGSFVKKYRIQSKQRDLPIDYEGFLQFIEDGLNQIQDEVSTAQNYDYSIRKGDTLGKLAEKFDISKIELQNYNNITKPDDIKHGKQIKIPLIDDAVRKKVFKRSIRFHNQNLNYIAKCKAIFKLVKEKYSYQPKFPADMSSQQLAKAQREAL